ncbi:uncharacterized protein (TIGR02145 family) [Chryseobacterium defluvii]|uniref:Uncharacterized protein (TIGR02145 family) n=1 Tax=Chryseobacterium defluvii TaxID=160396 RepID=A0A840KD62_9FLAO|nr:FISUMP domain-containing protein [Chryseobacterium defluvii]MBB4805937.1 uncharacterized protein (TIGR02145 family) [Chryseobacterium defluvii]
MIRKFITGFALTISAIVFSQVGIGTATPHTSADLELGSPNKALYLNRVANTSLIDDPQPGMLIYDLEDKCVKAYQGDPSAWSDCLIGSPVNGVGTVASLNCGSAAFSPASGTQGTAYTGTLTVPYTGGNGGPYGSQSFAQDGLTFTLPAGNFANGAGNLVYNITGTPTATGTISVNITAGGQSCNGLALIVNQNGTGVLPTNITLAQNRRYFIASVYDQDYLPYTAPAAPASTNVVNADGASETVTVNVQGALTTAGITVQIPVASVTGSGTINAWTNTIIVPASLTEDGVSRQIQLSWASQSYTASAKFITATIKSVGGTLNAKKLDINAGIGNDYIGILLGMFQYPYNNAGAVTGYEVRDIPGIPDRMFGLTDNTPAAGQRHNFLYLPVQAEDGNIWLNNNLGANYNNINHASFNPTQQATGAGDHNAYGSLFQWGRKPDGHELINRMGSTGGTGVTGTSTTKSNNPTHSLFIISNTAPVGDWRVNTDNTLWTTNDPSDNPVCPVGFHVPSETEFLTWINSAGVTNGPTSAVSMLKLPLSGKRMGTTGGTPSAGIVGNENSWGQYWSSTASTTFNQYAHPFVFHPSGYEYGVGSNRADGLTVRCKKD